VVRELSQELTQEKYHDAHSLQEREQVIERKWHNLVQKLDACRSTLSHYHDLMSVFAEMDDCLADMAQTEVLLKSEDYGKHLLGVQDLLQKHTLSEADITAQKERARSLEAQVQKFVEEKHPDSAKIVQKRVNWMRHARGCSHSLP